MRLRGAIFDADGTLLDSLSVWDTLGGDYLRSIGYAPREGLDEALRDLSLSQAARYYQDAYGVTLRTEKILEGVNALLERFYRFEAPLRPGAAALLAALRERGVRLCVATATDRRLIEAALERCGGRPYFDGVFTCEEVGHGKDGPQIYEAARRFLGTEREETLVFEDALYAVRTAKEAGFPVAAVHDCHETKQEEVRRLADVYLENLTELDRLEKYLSGASSGGPGAPLSAAQ